MHLLGLHILVAFRADKASILVLQKSLLNQSFLFHFPSWGNQWYARTTTKATS